MSIISCSNCGFENKITPPLFRLEGYSRCERCNIGLKWASTFGSEEVDLEKRYVPETASMSPKTRAVIDNHQNEKKLSKLYFLIGFSFIFPPLILFAYREKKRLERIHGTTNSGLI